MVARKSKQKNILAGYEDFQEKLDEFDIMLKDSVAESTEGQKRYQRDWQILRLYHQRARYIYDSYNDEKIPRDVYVELLKQPRFLTDKNLIAKWKQTGYERLCCLGCINTAEKNFGATCICRVPRDELKEDRTLECVTCGCNGCASCD